MMSRGELPQFEKGYELIVIQRGGDYIAAGKYRGSFGNQPCFRICRDLSAYGIRPADTVEQIEANIRVQYMELERVQLNELVDFGGVRSFRAWVVSRRDEDEMVKQQRFTAILGGQRYEGATQHVAITRNNEIADFVHQVGKHLNIELVSFVDIQFDRMVVGISGEKQPLLYIRNSDMIRMTQTDERAEYIIHMVQQALEARGELTKRRVHVQPVAEPEVVVANLVHHKRKLNLGD